MHIKSLPIRAILALYACAVLLPVICFTGALLLNIASDQARRTSERTAQLSSMTAMLLDMRVSVVEAALDALSESRTLEEADVTGFRQRAGDVSALHNRAVRFVPLSTSASRAMTSGVPEAYGWWISAPVVRHGVAIGTLEAQLSGRELSRLLAETAPDKAWTLSLVSSDGRIIARSSRYDDFVGALATPDLRANVTGEAGSWRGQTLDGEPVSAAYRRSPKTGLIVAAGVPLAAVAAPFGRNAMALAATGLLALLVSLSLAALLAKRIVTPLRELSAFGLDARIDPSRPPLVREIGDLQQSLISAASRITQHEEELLVELSRRAEIQQALAESQERLQSVADSMPVLISYIDADQRFQFANKAYEEWFGRPLSEIQGHSIRDVMGEAMYEPRRPYVERALAGEAVFYEATFPRADGPRITTIQHIPDRDTDGRIRGMYALVQDVTSAKTIELELRSSRDKLAEETAALEILNQTGAAIAGELDLDRVVQAVTDAGVKLTGAQFGAFFYKALNEEDEVMLLYALSGAEPEAFSKFPIPRATGIFAPTFAGRGVVRSDDITEDPRYGLNPPHNGMPKGHLPVRSYLAVPVSSRTGEVIGGLFFGHAERAVFNGRSERVLVGLAAQAAVATDNANLFRSVQKEVFERTKAEEGQQLLINELNHRVKNTLATVQAIASQSFRSSSPDELATFTARLIALSRAHDVLTRESWEGAELLDVVNVSLEAHDSPTEPRIAANGPPVQLSPKMALAVSMALHELATNAAKYGSLSRDDGQVNVSWSVEKSAEHHRLNLRWEESGGPEVAPPTRRGFGSRLVERALAADLDGHVQLQFPRTGVICTISAPLKAAGGDVHGG